MRAAEYQLAGRPREPAARRRAADAPRPFRCDSPVNGVVLRRLQESEAVVPIGHAARSRSATSTNLEIVSDLLSSAAVKVQAGAARSSSSSGAAITRSRPRAPRRAVGLHEDLGARRRGAARQRDRRFRRAARGRSARRRLPRRGPDHRLGEQTDVLKVPTSSLFRHEHRRGRSTRSRTAGAPAHRRGRPAERPRGRRSSRA